jgi:hypothetical protein
MSDLIDRGPGHGSAVNGIGYGAAALALTGLLAIIFLVWCRAGETYDVENLASRCDDPVLGGDPGVQPVRDGWSDWLSDAVGVGFTSFVARQCQPELAP